MQIWAWGRNEFGQLGDNSRTNRSSPVQTVSGTNWESVKGGQHKMAIKTDGTLWTWGSNSFGRFGDNSETDRSSPVQTVSGGTNWKSVAGGSNHIAAIKTDGTLWLWGRNINSGQLGDNSTTSKSSPVQTVAGGTNWKLVASGHYHTAAIKTDGTLWTWGYNSNGQLGDNSVTSRSSPVQTVAGGTNWKSVSSGSQYTAAIKTDGTLWLWGFNTFGGLGDNSITDRSSPVQTVAAGTNWALVDFSGTHTAAIKTDGTLWLWGFNSRGQLGDNSITNKSSPVQTVAGGANWKSVHAGSTLTGAIKTDGTLWTWGNNTYGPLGDNSQASKSSPVQTVAGGTNWLSVSAGVFDNISAIRDNSSGSMFLMFSSNFQ